LLFTNSAAGWSSDHFDQLVSVGSFTLPLRVATFSDVPCGSEPWSWILPNLLICVASSTALVNVPSLA